jgi:hypothetical protein
MASDILPLDSGWTNMHRLMSDYEVTLVNDNSKAFADGVMEARW